MPLPPARIGQGDFTLAAMNLQRQLDMLDEAGVERVFAFLGLEHGDEDLYIDLRLIPPVMHVALLLLISELLRESSSPSGRAES